MVAEILPRALKPPIRFRHAALLCGVIFAGMLAAAIWIPAGETRQAVMDGIYPILNFLAALALLRAARKSALQSRRMGLAWGFLSIAQLSYAIADLIWFILEACLHEQPYPSIADAFYLAYYPLFVIGILLMPGKRFSPRGQLEMVLDFAIIFIVATLGFWIYLLGPNVINNGNVPWLEQALGMAYPVADLVLLWALMMLAYGRSATQDRMPIFLLGSGMVSMIVTDCIYSYQTLAGTYESGGLVDTGYVATILLTGLAGLLQAWSAQSGADHKPCSRTKISEGLLGKPGRWQSYVPYVWVILGIGLMIESTHDNLPLDDTSISIGVGVVVCLVLLRQIIALVENTQLYRQLEGSTEALQQKTQETERHLERLQILRAIDQAILASPDLQGTLDMLNEEITRHLGVDAANILLYHPASQTLEVSANRGLKPSLYTDTVFRLGESHVGQVALEREMQLIADLGELDDSMQTRIRQSGEDYRGYVALPLTAKGELKGVLQLFQRDHLHPSPDWIEFLHTLAGQAAIAIDNAQLFQDQQASNLRLILAYDDTIDGWSRALDLRDRETEGHSQRVTDLTLQLARRLGLPESELVHIRRGAQLHDIGKMGIPDSILHKSGPLTDEEWTIMRRHPQYAYDLLAPIEYLRPALEIPLCHHEKWDGSGYPRHLKGEAIPLAARIFSVVDVWDALTSDRPYRPAWSQARATEHIREQMGVNFDPQVAEAFLKMVGEGFTLAGGDSAPGQKR